MEKDDRKLIAIFITIIMLSLFILYLIFSYNHCCFNILPFSITTLGLAGDFYGGILGTIVTFFGIYFIYQTFKLQDSQLDVAKKDSDLEIINKLYSDLLQEINSIQYRRITKNNEQTKEELFIGLDAIYNFDENHTQSPNSVLNHINSILFSFDQLIYMAEMKVKYKYQDMKTIMLTKIYFLYYSKITWSVYHRIYNERKLLGIESNPDYKSLEKNYKRLAIKTQKYLQEKNHIGAPITGGMKELLEESI